MMRRVLCTLLLLCSARGVAAQSLELVGPTGTTLPSLTPVLSARATGFGASLPLTVRLVIATEPDLQSGVLVDTLFTTADTLFTIEVTRVLPSEGRVYWSASVSGRDGTSAAFRRSRVHAPCRRGWS